MAGLPPSIKFASTHLYTWVERGTVRVKRLAQEHNTMSLARARTQTARSRVEHINLEYVLENSHVHVSLLHVLALFTVKSQFL